jgi:hypothetical protein
MVVQLLRAPPKPPPRSGKQDVACAVTVFCCAFYFSPVAGQAEDVSRPDENSTMPRCGPEMDGQVYCKFGALYECQLVGPNSMERRTGWRWKADILRACAAPSPAKTDNQIDSPEVPCSSEQTEHAHDRRGGAGASTGADGGPREGTMYIRPGGRPSPTR